MQNRKNQNKRLIISVVSGTLMLLLYLLIFTFSEQDGEQSGNLSALVSQICVDFLNLLSGGRWTELFLQELAIYFENPVRKLAHFTEYAILGILIDIFLSQWMRKGKRFYGTLILWIFLSAVSDELHQYFVPGRWASPLDVLLDTCGGAFAVWVITLCAKARDKKRQRNEGK